MNWRMRRRGCSVEAPLGDHGGASVLEGLSTAIAAHKARETVAALISVKLRAGALLDGFTRRDILQRRWSGLSSPEIVDAGLAALVERGILCGRELATGGRPKIVYWIAGPATPPNNSAKMCAVDEGPLGGYSAPPNGI